MAGKEQFEAVRVALAEVELELARTTYEEHLVLRFGFDHFVEGFYFADCVHFEFLFEELEETCEVFHSVVVDLVARFEKGDSGDFFDALDRLEFFFFVNVENGNFGLNKLKIFSKLNKFSSET